MVVTQVRRPELLGELPLQDYDRCGFASRVDGEVVRCTNPAAYHVMTPLEEVDPEVFWSLDPEHCCVLTVCVDRGHLNYIKRTFPVRIVHVFDEECADPGATFHEYGCQR